MKLMVFLCKILEMDCFYEKFSINEITQYHLERDEDISCLIEGYYCKDKSKLYLQNRGKSSTNTD